MNENRNTRKSRIVAEMADAIVELVSDGDRAPSKERIVTSIVDNNLGPGADSSVRAILEDEMANILERYWSDICKKASESMNHAAFHYVSRKYYRSRRMPETYEEALAFVICFGNGRRGKAKGVRFPTEEEEPDAMMLVATQKSIDVVNAAFKTHFKRIERNLDSPALPDDKRLSLKGEASAIGVLAHLNSEQPSGSGSTAA